MKEKMISFLNSIGISDYDSFDIDFEMVSRNRFDKNLIDMVIVKSAPWDYELLRRFQDGLSTITSYKYNLRFSYLSKPTSDYIIQLLNDWYQSIYHLPINLNIKTIDIEHIEIVYSSLEEQAQFEEVISEFKEFLRFLSYDFITVTTVVEESKEEEVASEEVRAETIEKAQETAETTIVESAQEEEINDRIDIQKQIELEQQERNMIVEDAMLREMKRNREQMEKERERARLNRRGNYVYFEKIDDITADSDHVDFNGFIFSQEIVERGDFKRVNLGIADNFGGAIHGSAYINATTFTEEKVKSLVRNTNVRIRGVVFVDNFTHQLSIKIHNVDLLPPDEIKAEQYEKNRVELHLHSNMSTQDGVSSMLEYANYAKALGHTCLSITDHGCVQGFPDAQAAAKAAGLKMLYGCEFYMIDENKYVYNPNEMVLNKASYVVFDLETTGLSARYEKIIEFGAVKISGGRVIDRVDILINPEKHIPEKITKITNITDSLVANEKKINEVLPRILEFIGDSILITHNAQFDVSFLNEALKENGYSELKNGVVDTLALSRYSFPDGRNHRLGTLCRRLEVEYDEESAHRADYDAFVLSEVWQILLVQLTKKNQLLKHSELANLETSKEMLTHMRPHHVIALAKNIDGLKDLYKLVSISNIDYLSGSTPLLPRKVLEEYRKNLFIGSACFNSDVYDVARYYNKDRLVETCKFYDYIEVQHPENYSFLVNMGEIENEDIEKYIKDIVEAGKEANKLVVATGDCHYVTPKEKIFRDVYISAPQVGKTNHPLNPFSRAGMARFENPNQHYRSTKEMLEGFAFLGEDLANEIVIENTNKIADEIEALLPVPNDHLYTPKIDNVENILKDLCYGRARELYGDPLPEFIQNRLDTELNGIIGNGYSVTYYIAHKLVKKSNEDGYIVGSRGSVGSSFAATMAGITEVNPLPPHYLCPHCHHLEWGKESYPDVRSGFDLPSKKCPICGEEMIRDGQDIPFETFLGFHAEKVPDIDLNFPGDYQAKAHEYTKVLLGKDNVFRAGTIETVAEKTAFGFARGYIERLGLDPNTYNKAKIEYLASGCVGVKRTTGQHPGGIVVIPNDHEVYDFTPIQWPADEVDSAWKTTHFDFHSIHDTVLKLDMLGHVDPVALRMMCQLTNIDIKDIPLNDPKVLNLFSSCESLEMKNNYLHQQTGAMAIPEFGTDFVRGILEKTRPTTFSDLVIISGLSHGTNVWNGNAEKLVNDKIATLQEVIGCRDDIMTYLIGKGLPSSISFAIMEDVRKGRGLKSEYEEAMMAHGVPEYYISSCKKIKYMFPKGHAVAYVTMAVRVGFFKVYYPLEFYATFFSVRSKQYDIIPMIKGEEAIIARLEQLKNMEKQSGVKRSQKEDDQYKTLQIAIEMVQRGYKFSNIDLYKSHPVNFVVDHENKCLIPPFTTIDGLGENNAYTVLEEREKKPFSSKEDLLKRTKLTTTNVNDLTALGVLDCLPENDQLSLFDFGDF